MADDVRVLVLEAPRTLVARSLPRPEVGSQDALLTVEACGLCGTDHEQYTGDMFGDFAFVPGHETVGRVAEIGWAAAELWGVAVGDRVAVECFRSCRECRRCHEGNYRRCEQYGIGSMYGWVDVERDPGLWGGYAEQQFLGPGSQLLAIPDDLDPVLATLFNPLGAGIRWGVTLPRTAPDEVVAVLGPGIRGICAAMAAKDAGAGFVMVTGHGDRDARRLELALQFGADLVVDVAEEDPVSALREATGQGADVVVDVTAKAPEAARQALDLARSGGRVVLGGVHGGTPEGFEPDTIMFKELTVIGAFGVDVVAYRSAIEMLSERAWPFEHLSRRVTGFDDVEDLLQVMAGDEDGQPPVHGVFVPE